MLHIGLHKIKQTIIDGILPLRCVSCGDIVNGSTYSQQSGFCPNCWSDVKFITPPWCLSCSQPFAYEPDHTADRDEHMCSACLITPPLHDGIRAALYYDDIPRDIILKLKYSGRIGIANLVAGHLSRFLRDDMDNLGDNIWLVPVPLHWTRLWKRTYNQSALIADALIQSLSRDKTTPEHIVDLLKRVKRTPPLRGNSGKDRKRLLKDAFALNPKYAQKIMGRTIILVDDVYTSGATTDACVKTLKSAGAAKVIIYCWTRVIK